MTENKRFTVKHIMFDGWCIYDSMDDKYYDYGRDDMTQLCKNMNHIIEANKSLEHKIISILDYIKEEQVVTHEEMKKFWNEELMNDG